MLCLDKRENASSLSKNFSKNMGEYARIMEQELQDFSLGEEKDIFIRCFSDVGYADEWLQRRNIERGRERLKSLLDKEEEDLKKRSKLAVSLGTMSGILLVLILL